MSPAAEADPAPAKAPTPPAGGTTKRSWWRLRRVRPSLRTEMALMFALGSLLLSGFLAMAAYTFTRSSLLAQRDRSSIEQGYSNAQIAQNDLISGTRTAASAIERLRSLGVSRSAVFVDDTWARSSSRFGEPQIPASLRQRVINDKLPARMVVRIEGRPNMIIGVPLTATDAAYFEVSDLGDVSSTLNSVRLSLLFGGLIATMSGAVVGWFAANRTVRPLGDAARAAKAIAGGRLDTRLVPTRDQDLGVLAEAFNDMAAALQTKIERDNRFASDVSHELRSPLMTLAASAEVMQARRDEMPARAQAALDLLVADVTRFQGLVEDLLEISRFDAGAIRLHLEELLVGEFVRQAVAVSSLRDAPVAVTDEASQLIINGDRRRLARVIANLIDNARNHGGGMPTVTVESIDDGGHVQIAVEDHGTGVPVDELA
ncbi:MAG TPA: HAMP domain-containing sensor histidine kinase, partial [Ilumatobacteraceae bacterium]|nr:HAMP domain-containing sensor histidine kinase [Ilumatobacteraceae bacterium]